MSDEKERIDTMEEELSEEALSELSDNKGDDE